MDYIVLSIPIFFLLIGLELFLAKIKKSPLYRLNDAVTNISCGITQQVSGAFFKTFLIVGYIFIYNNYKIWELPDTWWSYMLLFVGIDFFYYWFHRYSHEIAIFWGAHIVHHQSEDYNFSVALRQSAFQAFISTWFYLPLAWIGFNPIAFITINAFQTLYQFWIHTKTIHKLPRWIEYVFNTPSHHRVHHGRNPKYIDKNHGGTLILFDRWFGTYQAEEEEVVYGVTKPLASWNPVWANFDYYVDLWNLLKQPMSWEDRFKVLFRKPGWRPKSLGGYQTPTEVSAGDYHKFDDSVAIEMNIYILIQYIFILAITSYFLFSIDHFTWVLKLMFSAWIMISISVTGGLFEEKSWAIALEYGRHLLWILIAWYSFSHQWLLLVMVILPLISALWFYYIRSSMPKEMNSP